ncbi:hypothetical protein HPB50_007789 [Hyalomma asiaticum]|uniref:Uncharacterized protein n=1 Tax=Hyalomma asiaticum TaxID=266040 RepID=A0ACB7RN06_HYAAI|nr:hypothetical protein HPB50_007789 [Hyalomma asiaticum]
MKPSDGHSRRICKILKSEWWRQVRTFKDLLRIACANGMDGHPGYRQYRQWCNVADSTSEFLWRTVRPTLPVQKKGNPVQGHVLNLSTTPIPEEHERVLGLGPKYCFEPHLNPFEKIATARAVSRWRPPAEARQRRLRRKHRRVPYQALSSQNLSVLAKKVVHNVYVQVSVGTQVQLQDLVSALQPSQRELGGTQRAPSTRGQKASTSAGISQRSAEAVQTSLTVLKGRLPTKKPTPPLTTSSEEHSSGADSMEVCAAADTEETGEFAASGKPPKSPVTAPNPVAGAKGLDIRLLPQERAHD